MSQSHPKVQLRALKGFVQATQFVRRGRLLYRSRKVAADLIRSGYCEEVPTPIQAMLRAAKKLGVALSIQDGTKHAAEIVAEAKREKVGVADQRTKPKQKKGDEAQPEPAAS